MRSWTTLFCALMCASGMRGKREAVMGDALQEKNPRKKATNLSVRTDLLEVARNDGLNLSSMLEDTLMDYCKKKRERQWLEDNKEGIAAYNERIDKCGVFGAKYRRF